MPTGRESDRIAGMAFEITDEQLRQANAYVVSSYRWVGAPLASGSRAWVYVGQRWLEWGLIPSGALWKGRRRFRRRFSQYR
jgi:hypothetical protein